MRLWLNYTHSDGRPLQATFSLTSRYDIETLLREAGWLPRRPVLDRRL